MPAEAAAQLPAGDLVDRVSALVEQARESIAAQANATLTLMFCQMGRLIDAEVLASERADYGAETVVTLSRQLAARDGRSLEEKNLRRMIQFARTFPDLETLATMSLQLSWSHLVTLLRSPHRVRHRPARPRVSHIDVCTRPASDLDDFGVSGSLFTTKRPLSTGESTTKRPLSTGESSWRSA